MSAEKIKETEIEKLRKKLLDVEEIACRLEDINNLFTSFANENCPEGTIVAGLINEQLKALQNTVKI